MGPPRAGNMQPGGRSKGSSKSYMGQLMEIDGEAGVHQAFISLVVIRQATTARPGMQEAWKGSLGCIPGGTCRKGTCVGEEGRLGVGRGPRDHGWEVRSGWQERNPGHSSARSQCEMGPAQQGGRWTAGCWELAVGLTAAHTARPAMLSTRCPTAWCSALLWSLLLPLRMPS